MADALHDQIRDFILENYLFTNDASALGLDDSLLGRGIVDSTGMLEIIFFIEEQLGVKVKDEEMIPDNLDSVNRIAAFVAVEAPGRLSAAMPRSIVGNVRSESRRASPDAAALAWHGARVELCATSQRAIAGRAPQARARADARRRVALLLRNSPAVRGAVLRRAGGRLRGRAAQCAGARAGAGAPDRTLRRQPGDRRDRASRMAGAGASRVTRRGVDVLSIAPRRRRHARSTHLLRELGAGGPRQAGRGLAAGRRARHASSTPPAPPAGPRA